MSNDINLKINETNSILRITGEKFSIGFDKKKGVITSYITKGKEIFVEPLLPCFWRVPTDNDEGGGNNSFAGRWRKAGLNDYRIENRALEITNQSPQRITITTVNNLVFKTGTILQTTEYIINADGKILVNNTFQVDESLPPLARVGMYVALPNDFNEIEWYGRGPFESYEDRKNAAHIGLWSGSVEEQFFDHVMPQENGNKADVRWLKLKFQETTLHISGVPTINFNVQNYSDKALNESKTTHVLKRGDKTYLHIDYRQMGLGGDDSWSPRVHREFLLNNKVYQYSFVISLP